MVLARQVPMNLGGGDMFKILKSKMVYKGGFHGTMNRREAGLVLGVKQNATKEEIRSRHRKLMVFNHPDNGTINSEILGRLIKLFFGWDLKVDHSILQRRSTKLKNSCSKEKFEEERKERSARDK